MQYNSAIISNIWKVDDWCFTLGVFHEKLLRIFVSVIGVYMNIVWSCTVYKYFLFFMLGKKFTSCYHNYKPVFVFDCKALATKMFFWCENISFLLLKRTKHFVERWMDYGFNLIHNIGIFVNHHFYWASKYWVSFYITKMIYISLTQTKYTYKCCIYWTKMM